MQRLPKDLAREINHRKHRSMEEVAKAAFASCAKSLRDQFVVSTRSGTTATIVYLDGRELWTFHVGDSRAVLAQKIEDAICACAVSRDHSPDDPEERTRVRNLGARVEETCIPHIGPTGTYRVIMGPVSLAMTRAFGDFGCGACILPEPEVHHHTLTEGRDLALVLASDGVWTFMENHNVIERALEAETAQEACNNIYQQAVLLWEQDGRVDDISLCVLFFKGHIPMPKTPKSHIVPLQLLDDRRKVVFQKENADEFRKLVNQLDAVRNDSVKFAEHSAKWRQIQDLLDIFDEQLAQTEPRPALDACQESLLPVRERALRIPLQRHIHGVYGLLECLVSYECNKKLQLCCRVAVVKGPDVIEILVGKLQNSLHILRRVERALSKGHFTVAHGSSPIFCDHSHGQAQGFSQKVCEMNLQETLVHAMSCIQVRLESHDRKEEKIIIPLVEDASVIINSPADRKLSIPSYIESIKSDTLLLKDMQDSPKEDGLKEDVLEDGPKKGSSKADVQKVVKEHMAGTNEETPEVVSELVGVSFQDDELPPELLGLLPVSYKRNLSIAIMGDLGE